MVYFWDDTAPSFLALGGERHLAVPSAPQVLKDS